MHSQKRQQKRYPPRSWRGKKIMIDIWARGRSLNTQKKEWVRRQRCAIKKWRCTLCEAANLHAIKVVCEPTARPVRRLFYAFSPRAHRYLQRTRPFRQTNFWALKFRPGGFAIRARWRRRRTFKSGGAAQRKICRASLRSFQRMILFRLIPQPGPKAAHFMPHSTGF